MWLWLAVSIISKSMVIHSINSYPLYYYIYLNIYRDGCGAFRQIAFRQIAFRQFF